jgi:hypothetical protein
MLLEHGLESTVYFLAWFHFKEVKLLCVGTWSPTLPKFLGAGGQASQVYQQANTGVGEASRGAKAAPSYLVYRQLETHPAPQFLRHLTSSENLV